MPITAKDIKRNLWHSCGGMVLPVAYLFLEKNRMLPLVCGLTACALAFEFLRLRNASLNAFFLAKMPIALKERERTGVTGSTFFLIGSALTVLLFAKPVAILGMAYLSVGDASAVVVGRSFGRHKILNGTKSLEGSAGCFLACSAAGLILGLGWLEMSVAVILVGALAATVIELFNLRVDDNLTIPLASAAAMWLALLL